MDPAPPTFANTIEALESADEPLSRVLGVFYTLASTVSTPEREALQREFSPRLAAYSSEIARNRPLSARIEALWEGRDALDLDDEQRRVLYLTHRGFVRAGAALEGEPAERLAEIKERLAVLGTRFTQNLLADERDWSMPLDDAALSALPDFVVEAARAAGEERDTARPLVTLSRSLIVPFLQFSPAANCAAAPGAPGRRAARTAARRTTAPSPPRSWRCARNVQKCWDTRTSPNTSSKPRWRRPPTLCATC